MNGTGGSFARCGLCGKGNAEWTCWPFGPAEVAVFKDRGKNEKGYPAIPACDNCRIRFDNSHDPLTFYYANRKYAMRRFNKTISIEEYRRDAMKERLAYECRQGELLREIERAQQALWTAESRRSGRLAHYEDALRQAEEAYERFMEEAR